LGIFSIAIILFLVFFSTSSCIEPWPEDCPYQKDTDLATIKRIIQAEAEAANQEDTAIIRDIFAPDAIIIFEKTGETWNDPLSHYVELFKIFDFTEALNFDIKPYGKGITEDTAYIISSNSGIYTMNGGEQVVYNNTNPKDSWILKKNDEGCWVIVEYRYH
jgi:ketosteroid isomerase-like protein